jgi:glycosyltransferase involved in cell wall biosynthesis
MKRNILFVSHSAELYGAERVLLQTIQGLNKETFNSILVLPKSGPLGRLAEELGIETFCVPSKWWITEKRKVWKQPFSWLWNLKSLVQMSRLIDKKKIDLVFSNTAVNFTGAIAARLKNIPHIWSVHEILEGSSSPVGFLLGKLALVGIISALSTRIIVNSEMTGLPFKKNDKLRKVNIGVRGSRKDKVSGDALRRRLGFDPKDFVIGVVGKIYPEKGQKEVVEAVNMIIKTNPQVRLLIVGGVKNAGYQRKIQKFISVNHLERHVVVTGYQQDILEILSMLNLLVVASIVESFGRVALEAMAVKTPVLAVRRGGISEVISPGENGFLVESRDPKILAQGIRSVLESPEQVSKITEKGYQKVQEKYSLEIQIGGTEKVLKECFESEFEDGDKIGKGAPS